MKCASRGLDCPGFKTVYLKWDQGIASRGRLAGKSTPIIKGADKRMRNLSSKERNQCKVKDPSRGVRIRDRISGTSDDEQVQTTSIQIAPTAASPMLNPAFYHVEATHVVDPFLQSSIFSSLINHFCTKAVSRLTWIDQPRHPLRTIVRQLLQKSKAVRFSVGCLAAAHMSMVPNIPGNQASALFHIYASLRDESMRTLSAKMRRGLPGRSPETSSASDSPVVIELLATMLVLCYAEVLVPGSKDWRLHLRGCRTIRDLHPLQDWFKESKDPVIRFLLKEISDLEMLTGISMFHQDFTPIRVSPLPSSTDSGWAFTKLIYAITELERERYYIAQAGNTLPSIDMSVWCRRAEEAHNRSLACMDCLCESQQGLRDCFEAVSRAHYFATIIYSYQAFKTPAEKALAVPELLEPLLADIRFVMAGPTDELFHDLFFPLFIAGIECVYDPLRRSEIDGCFIESLSRTGVWCNYSALQFLRSFWSVTSTSEHTVNWMDFARANLSSMEAFIVF